MLAIFLGKVLKIIGWKRRVVLQNRKIMGLAGNASQEQTFLGRFYGNLTQDFFACLVLKYLFPVYLSEKDRKKLHDLNHSGGLLLTAHFHNWEWMGRYLTQTGVQLVAVAKPLHSPFSQKILQAIRTRLGIKILWASKRNSFPRRALQVIRSGGVLGVLWDQNDPASRLESQFFKKKVRMYAFPAWLQNRQKCAVYCFYLMPDGRLRILSLCPRGKKMEAARLARRYNRVLETLIHIRPQYYYGFLHKKFKTNFVY